LIVQLVSKISNLCDLDPDPPTLQTDGRTTCNLNTALCTSASRGNKPTANCMYKYYHKQCYYKAIYLRQCSRKPVQPLKKRKKSCFLDFQKKRKNVTRCHAIAGTTARCVLYMSALKIVCKRKISRRLRKIRIATLQSYHYSVVQSFSKCSHPM